MTRNSMLFRWVVIPPGPARENSQAEALTLYCAANCTDAMPAAPSHGGALARPVLPRTLAGEWSLPNLAGGCPKHNSWAQNPQFEVRVSAPTTLVAVLSLKATPGNPAAQTTPVCTNLPGTTTSIGGTG